MLHFPYMMYMLCKSGDECKIIVHIYGPPPFEQTLASILVCRQDTARFCRGQGMFGAQAICFGSRKQILDEKNKISLRGDRRIENVHRVGNNHEAEGRLSTGIQGCDSQVVRTVKIYRCIHCDAEGSSRGKATTILTECTTHR